MRPRFATLMLCGGMLSCAPQHPPTTLRVAYPIMLALADVQREFTVETVYCLQGHVDNGAVVVDAMHPPVIVERTSSRVLARQCADEHTVAWFHNHPTQADGRDYCWPSSADVSVLERNPTYHAMLVSCARGAFVYRFRGDSVNYYVPEEAYTLP